MSIFYIYCICIYAYVTYGHGSPCHGRPVGLEDAGLTSADLALGARVKFLWEAAKDARGPGGRARYISLLAADTPSRPRAPRTGRATWAS